MSKFTLSALNPKLLRAAVYGANDGIITTFAVVAGSAGAQLSVRIVLILGIANLLADGVSMGLGDFLGERSEQRLRKLQGGKYESKDLWHSGVVTFVAFAIAGIFPLIPYLIQVNGMYFEPSWNFPLSIMNTTLALFAVGSLRTIVTKGSWWKNGLEMLSIGAAAAVIAYSLGYLVDVFTAGTI